MSSFTLSDYQQVCPECRGTGRADHNKLDVCEECGGKGVVLVMPDGDKLMRFIQMFFPDFCETSVRDIVRDEIDRRGL